MFLRTMSGILLYLFTSACVNRFRYPIIPILMSTENLLFPLLSTRGGYLKFRGQNRGERASHGCSCIHTPLYGKLQGNLYRKGLVPC